jgi:hypothetical protein
MNILLYNPDNEVTHNFMPHLWMFLLKSLTPAGHEVFLLDGNANRMSEQELAQYVRDKNVGLVGIGAMTRMAAKAYRMADAVRAAGVPVVMGGPHVTEVPDEPLDATVARAMPTPSLWARPTPPGRPLWPTPRAALCGKSTSPWTPSARK